MEAGQTGLAQAARWQIVNRSEERTQNWVSRTERITRFNSRSGEMQVNMADTHVLNTEQV